MATIRASCPDCGDVEVTTQDMTVRVCVDNNEGSYVFRCPDCIMMVSKQAEQRIVDLLVSSGVKVEPWSLPSELREQPGADRLTHDDLLDFHELLEGDRWFDEVFDLMWGPAGPPWKNRASAYLDEAWSRAVDLQILEARRQPDRTITVNR